MKFAAVVEYCRDTNLYAGYVPGFTGAHSQGATLDELYNNLQEVIAMLLEDDNPPVQTDFTGARHLDLSLTIMSRAHGNQV